MHTKHLSVITLIALFGSASFAGGGDYKPVIAPSEFTHKITHPYFPLTPGTVRKYSLSCWKRGRRASG